MSNKPKDDLPEEVEELRQVVAENISHLLTSKGLNDRSLEKVGVPKNSLNRARRGIHGPTLDTLALIAKGLNVQPALLLMRGGAKHVAEVFTPPVPDAKLGSKWTRPDRRPLIEGSGNGKPLGVIPPSKKKIKSRA